MGRDNWMVVVSISMTLTMLEVFCLECRQDLQRILVLQKSNWSQRASSASCRELCRNTRSVSWATNDSRRFGKHLNLRRHRKRQWLQMSRRQWLPKAPETKASFDDGVHQP